MNKTHPIFLSDTPNLDAQPDAAQPEWVRIDGEPTCLDCGSLEWSGHLANCPSRQRRAQPDNAPDEFRPRLGGGFELAGAPDELAQDAAANGRWHNEPCEHALSIKHNRCFMCGQIFADDELAQANDDEPEWLARANTRVVVLQSQIDGWTQAVAMLTDRMVELEAQLAEAQRKHAKLRAVLEGAGYNQIDDMLTRDIEVCRLTGQSVAALTQKHIDYGAQAEARIKELEAQLADYPLLTQELERLRASVGPQTCDIHAAFSAGCLNCRLSQRETQLAEARSRAERWRLAAEEGSWPFEWQAATEYKGRAEKAEAQLAEARNAINIHVAQSERINGELAAEVVRLEAQLAEANARAETAERRAEDADFNSACEIKEKMRLRAALEAVVTYFAADESGPIYSLWANGDICSWDDNPRERWTDVLADLADDKLSTLDIGHGVEWEAVALYRAVLAALSPRGEGEECAATNNT